MTDWSKLKVTDLKAELKKRGLPQAGVKAALVARLEGAENEDGAESETTVQGDTQKPYTDSATSPDTISPVLPSDAGAEILPNVPAPQPKAQTEPANEDTVVGETSQTTTIDSELLSTQPAETVESSQPPASSDEHKSALPSVEPQEAIDDRQKRKRRSQSPPPSTADIARKRLRIEDEPAVQEKVLTTKEDAAWVEKHNAVDEADINAESKEVAPSGSGVEPGSTIVDFAKNEVEVEQAGSSGDAMDVHAPKQEGMASSPSDDSTHKSRDSRFKSLFSGDTPQGTAMAISSSRDSSKDEAEPERTIGPAVHPATSALYIRDIMRPLNQVAFKTHIATLAAPPGQEADEEVILDFFIDQIKTHAFIVFANISAASRVRSALHDRIWPDEKTRKPLWIDFIPEESVQDWIQQEQEGNTGGRGITKKWEIFYEVDDDRLVTAHLQEANSGPRLAPRKPSLQAGPSQTSVQPRGIDGAPSGPRASATMNRPQPVADDGRSKLNELFKSTTTKPVLYWQPVSKELANRRLDSLEDAYSKDARAGARVTGEVNRYTFENNDVLVDRGVELVPGLRPPPGYRAPRPGLDRGAGAFRGSGRGGYGRPPPGRSYDSYRGGGGGERRDPRDYGGRY